MKHQLKTTAIMNIETDRGQVTKDAEPWVRRLIGSAMIALTAIWVGRSVFGSITGLFLAEAVFGGLAGWRYTGFSLAGAVLAFSAWISFEILQDGGAIHGEGIFALLLMSVGTTIFVISGSVVSFFMKKRDVV
jgi:hypothetical protein